MHWDTSVLGILLSVANLFLSSDFGFYLQVTFSQVYSTSCANFEVDLHISGCLMGIPKCPTGCRPRPPSSLKKRTLLWTPLFHSMIPSVFKAQHWGALLGASLAPGSSYFIPSYFLKISLIFLFIHISCFLFFWPFIYTWATLPVNYFFSLMFHATQVYILQINLCTFWFLRIKILLWKLPNSLMA